MGKLANKQINIPKVALEDYFLLVSGDPKAGKTTLFAKLAEKYFGDINNCLLIAFEKGYTALKIVAQDINDWEDFEEVVEELIEDKNSLPYKYLALDTVDIMYEMATDQVIKEWNQKNPQKRAMDIAGVGAKGRSDQGFGVGYQRVKQKIRRQIDRLMKAGYGIMAITHSKDKEVQQKDGLSYDLLTVSLPGSAREVFINLADFIIFITIEKEEINKKIFTKRYMYFRTDGYVEAGSRFQNVPEKIEYDIEEFIGVFKTAVQSEFEDLREDEVAQIKEKQNKEKEEKTKEFIKQEQQEKSKLSPEEYHTQIRENIAKLTGKDKKIIKEYFEETLGTASFTAVNDIDLLQNALDFVVDIVTNPGIIF